MLGCALEHNVTAAHGDNVRQVVHDRKLAEIAEPVRDWRGVETARWCVVSRWSPKVAKGIQSTCAASEVPAALSRTYRLKREVQRSA